MRRASLLLLGAAGAAPAVAAGAGLQVGKAVSVVADGVNTLNPKALPGADIDTALTVTAPVANGLASVAAVTVVDAVPAQAKLRVADYPGGSGGPVRFVDGSLLGLGLLGSGLTYRFASLASGTDGVEFSDGQSWSYVPVPDADGCDAKVRAIRVTLTGTQGAGSAFQLRYRVRLR